MAGKIIADTIQAAGSYITLNVGNVTILTANSTGLTITPSSNLNFNVTNSIWTASPGSNSAPSLTFSGNTSTGIFFPSTNTVAISTAATEALRVDSAGNLGIGTTTTNSKLNIFASSTNTSVLGTYANIPLLLKNTSSTNNNWCIIGTQDAAGNFATFFGTQTTNQASALSDFVIGTNPGSGATERMRIDSYGNVGIGESASIVRKLCITASGTTATTRAGIQLKNEVGTTAEIYQGPTSNNALIFEENGSERMRIDASGNLLVGLTSFASGNTGVLVRGTNSGATDEALQVRVAGTGSVYNTGYYNNNGRIGSVTTNGSTTSFNTSSDYRLKENITPMTGALTKVSALKPVTYKWKVDGSDGQGFIAHELSEVIPQCVVGEKDAVDAEGNPQYQGIDTSFLVATLTAAIQELKVIVDAQAVEIAALKAK